MSCDDERWGGGGEEDKITYKYYRFKYWEFFFFFNNADLLKLWLSGWMIDNNLSIDNNGLWLCQFQAPSKLQMPYKFPPGGAGEWRGLEWTEPLINSNKY